MLNGQMQCILCDICFRAISDSIFYASFFGVKIVYVYYVHVCRFAVSVLVSGVSTTVTQLSATSCYCCSFVSGLVLTFTLQVSSPLIIVQCASVMFVVSYKLAAHQLFVVVLR